MFFSVIDCKYYHKKVHKNFMKITRILPVGFAMFAMLFGAGNSIFPLVLGRDLGDKIWFGLIGFVATAVIVPLVGLVATMLRDGEYKKLLYGLGPIPGAIIAFVCLIAIGPFGATPRCVTVAYAALKLYIPQLSLMYFSIIAAALIYLFSAKENKVVDLIGKYLGPIQLALLLIVIIKGLLAPAQFLPVSLTNLESFTLGISSGYYTMDIFGAIFFSGLIFASLKSHSLEDDGTINYKQLATMGLQAGVIGALMLGLVYTGFCIVAAFYGPQIAGVARSDIFSVLVSTILGGVWGVLANSAVAISCLTTSIALTTVFAEYIRDEIFSGKINYHFALITTILITTVMANLGFEGIMVLIGPFVTVMYPALIVLSIATIAHILWGFKWVKIPVAITFLGTLLLQYVR